MPGGVDVYDPDNKVIYECWPAQRMRDFSWDKLQALDREVTT
jgi:hypothetical protein